MTPLNILGAIFMEIEGESNKKLVLTEEVLEDIRDNASQDEKLDHILYLTNENSREINAINNTLRNGWDKMLWKNTWFRQTFITLAIGAILAGIGYLFTIL